MKLKEICEKTGLTRRTIRFYEEKALFSPKKIYRNGREYREYSEEDVLRLLDIATLRKARFTIQEIKQMEAQPEDLPEVFTAYRDGLYEQRKELDSLIRVAETVKPENLTSTRQLIDLMAQTTAEMPLPAIDVRPHFRYLDELEESLMGRRKRPTMTEAEKRQRKIAAENAVMYAAFSVQNAPGNNMAAGGKGGGTDIGNAQKIAAYNLLVNTRDD